MWSSFSSSTWFSLSLIICRVSKILQIRHSPDSWTWLLLRWIGWLQGTEKIKLSTSWRMVTGEQLSRLLLTISVWLMTIVSGVSRRWWVQGASPGLDQTNSVQSAVHTGGADQAGTGESVQCGVWVWNTGVAAPAIIRQCWEYCRVCQQCWCCQGWQWQGMRWTGPGGRGSTPPPTSLTSSMWMNL